MKRMIAVILLGLITLFSIFGGCTKEQPTIAVSQDGSKIKFSVEGKGEPVLIFVHGLSNNRTVWEQQVSQFSPKYRVITLDLAGFGESDNTRKNWTMANYGEDVLAVINKLNLKGVILIGHSMGGAVVIEASKKSPEKIMGIVLVDVFQNIEAKYSADYITNLWNLYKGILDSLSIEKVKIFFKQDPELSERYLKMVMNAPKLGWEESFHDFFRWSNDDLLESLKELKVPLIAINSSTTPTNIDAYRQYIPSFKAKIIDDVCHHVFWEAPEKFEQLLEESIQEFMNK